MRDDLIAFLLRVENDAQVRCVVLRGAGSNFMAGGDVKSFVAELGKSPETRRSFFEQACHSMHPIIYLIRRMQKPVIASVAGACAGLGMSLVLACDLAIAAEDAFFTPGVRQDRNDPRWRCIVFSPLARSVSSARWKSPCSAIG